MLTTCIKRLKAETPDFFKKLQKLSISLGISAVAVWTANSTLDLQLDETTITICKYTIAVCAAIAGTSQFTAKNPENL